MSLFEDCIKKSVKCNRNKCVECVNKSGNCGCECHVIIQKNNEFVNEINEIRNLASIYNDRRILSWINRVLN